MRELIQAARQKIAQAESLAVLTGAGVSAESGVPTFRGPGGLWENNRPEELATPQAFAKDPALVWRWYNWRRELISRCQPNPAHQGLARLESLKSGFTLITQNVDGLHSLAGSKAPLEIHGCIWRLRCLGCQDLYEDRSLDLATPPYCQKCGSLLRPDVVWFGESLDPDILERSWQAAQSTELMLVIGTSALVQPAAGLASLAKDAGAFVIEINPEATPNSSWVDISLRGPAGEIMPQLLPGD